MNRRALGLGAVAALAAAAGGGTAWWRAHARPAASDDESAPVDVWTQRYPTLDGSVVRMADLRGRPLLLNFWATWCAPCVKEMPLLAEFASVRAGAGWQVLALAIDGAEPVHKFVVERSLAVPVALAGAAGIDLSRALGNVQGALPFTVVFDSGGQPAARSLGAVRPEQLAEWVGRVR